MKFFESKPTAWIVALAALAVCPQTGLAQTNPDGTADTGDGHSGQMLLRVESPDAVAKRLEWWSNDRFGMFIHWGLYAQDGCFWKGKDGKTEHMMRHLQIPIAEYEKIATEFNPVKFNADEWVQIAKNAGMKYMIITSKHHDGFAMYDAKSSDYNIVKRTPWKRDPVAELNEACKKAGLRFGVYYSLGRDWHDPDVPTSVKTDGSRRSNTWDFPDEDKKDFTKYFERKVKPQVRELMTQYQPAIMWFDTPEKISKAQSEELLKLIHSIKPDCIVNARIGNRLGDYAVEEQHIPETGAAQPWEVCKTLNDHWGYKKGDNNWKATDVIIRQNLIDIVSKGGNFLFNVGPTGEGIIPGPSVDRLKQVGDWMKVNGEAIYGTTASPFKKLDWGRATKKVNKDGATIYLHVYNWPADGKLVVPGLKNVESASLLADGKKLTTTSEAGKIIVNVPATAPDKISSTVVLKVKGPIELL